LRTAREREARLEQALARLPEIKAIKERQGKKPEEVRVSMTDAEATVMKMGDGSFRPAYNPQFASDADSLVIVRGDVVTIGSDQRQMVSMLEQVMARCGQAPESCLVDGDFVGHEQIEQASRHTVVYGLVPEPKDKTVDSHRAKRRWQPGGSGWGAMKPKPIYKKRAATAECVNAQSRNRGLQQFRVRGLAKVKCVVRFFALAHNLIRMAEWVPQLLGVGTSASAVLEMGI
jgi:hypothetical protein